MSEETRRLAVYGCVVEVLKQEAKNWPTSVSEETGLVCDLGLDSISINPPIRLQSRCEMASPSPAPP